MNPKISRYKQSKEENNTLSIDEGKKQKEYRGWIKVTNMKGTLKDGTEQIGFPIDGYLKSNLDGVPRFLKMGYDCIGIISGMSKVRIGKSTIAIGTVGSYLAWLLAGGIHKCHQEVIEGKQRWITDKIVQPKNKINFNVYENVAFSADELQRKAIALEKKYGKHQILIYDEGRQGLDSARAMESINRGMEDFMQTCGVLGHVIIIVLPSFFKLHEDYAIARSLFLINVYANKKYQRGFYSFYNEEQKEKLFFFGKKRIGIRAKYMAASENFWGTFSSWFPFDRDEYDKLKKEAIMKIRKSKQQQKFKKQRDYLMYMLQKHADIHATDIARELSALSGIKVSERNVQFAISNITKQHYDEIE